MVKSICGVPLVVYRKAYAERVVPKRTNDDARKRDYFFVVK